VWTWRKREDGQATAEYLGIVVIVALVIAALVAAVVLPGNGNVSQDLRAAICRIHLADCDGAGTSGGGSPEGSPGGSTGGSSEGSSGANSGGTDVAQPGSTTEGPGGSGQPTEGDSDCHGFWGCTWEGVQQVGSGIYNVGKGAVDDVTGLIDLVADPGKIIDAGKYIWNHPLDSVKELIWDQESSQMWDNGDYGGSIGRTIWNVGSWFIPFYGIGKAGAKGGKLGDLGKVADAADTAADLSRLADDAARFAREAEAAAARGDLAGAEKAARQARAEAEAAKTRARQAGCVIAARLPGQRSATGLVLAAGGGRLGMAAPVPALRPLAGPEDCGKAGDAARKAEEEAAAAEKAAAEAAALNNGLGPLVPVKVNDPAAIKLAERLNGQPSVKFAQGPDNEFDTVSDLYVAQSKPANFTLNKAFRDQAKVTFETAVQTGRTPYFHFEGPPGPGVLQALQRYADRYGVEPVIDTVPLGGP
jgi:hypothetical protein